ncbi:MAG: glycosyltransferase [Candidatus Eremiobacteraeota bacterium]|nr:glycosyltransferase [Candidatus Eremiobacteraeota bacterium]
MKRDAHTSIVIATRNRCAQLSATLERLIALDDIADLVVVDNASSDGTAAHVRKHFPQVRVIALCRNEGAFARTLGARHVGTPYIAFCDDDTWWLPGSIARGAHVLASYRDIGLLNACVTVERSGRIDEACIAMSASSSVDGLPGAPIVFFMAGASMVRTDVFLQCGGYERRFMIGGEETLLALELHRRGWLVRYLPDIHVRHAVCSQERDDAHRRRLLIRNRLWVAWMRYRRASAWRATLEAARCARRDAAVRAALLSALGGLLWAISNRNPVDVSLQRRIDEVWSVSGR